MARKLRARSTAISRPMARKAWADAKRGGERGEKEEKETVGRNKEKRYHDHFIFLCISINQKKYLAEHFLTQRKKTATTKKTQLKFFLEELELCQTSP